MDAPRTPPKSNNEPEWRRLARTGYIREKFLYWSPEDIKECSDIEELMYYRFYYTPHPPLRNPFERAFCSLMIEAIDARLSAFR